MSTAWASISSTRRERAPTPCRRSSPMAGPAPSLRCTRSSPVPRRGEAGAGARGLGREATRRVAVHHGKRQPLGKQPAHRPGDGGQAPASRRGLGYLDINLRDQYPQRRCDRHRVGKGWDSCGSSNRHDAGGKGRGLQPHSSGQGASFICWAIPSSRPTKKRICAGE
jgi:hypothetical protein